MCSILKIVRTPVVKQSLLRGIAHFVPTAVADEEVPPQNSEKAAEPHR